MERPEMTSNRCEDAAWIRRTLAGDRGSFEHLIRKYQDRLFDMAYRILGNRSDAEDILQDAFISIYRHLAGFNHECQFSTWIYSIVLNRIRNHLRHAKIIRWSSLDAPIATEEGERTLEIPDQSDSLDEVTARKLQVEAVKREALNMPLAYQ